MAPFVQGLSCPLRATYLCPHAVLRFYCPHFCCVGINWTKLMQILKRIGIDWRERRVINRLYMEHKVKVRLDRGETRSVKTDIILVERGVRQGCCLSQILFDLYSECLTKEALGGLGDFKAGGQIIQTEICRWPCVNGLGRNGDTGHDW